MMDEQLKEWGEFQACMFILDLLPNQEIIRQVKDYLTALEAENAQLRDI